MKKLKIIVIVEVNQKIEILIKTKKIKNQIMKYY